MSVKCWVFVAILLLYAATVGASTEVSTRVLRVYGPGGPHHVIKECAQLFSARHGVIVQVKPHDLKQQLDEDVDIYYGGAEYMLEDFALRNPGVLDITTLENLHPRRIGILVREGNPLKIMGTEDLREEGVDLLDVQLENMRHLHGAPSGLSSNIRHFAYTGQQGVNAWRSSPELDAWVTYKTWHLALEAESDFIEIPGAAGLRYTPMALTQQTPHRQEAMNFISFLKSAEARQIFKEHGWY